MTQSTRLRLGVVGAGRRGSEHIPSILALPDLYDLVAICDARPEVATKAAGRAEAHPYTSIHEMLTQEKLDALVITTPRETHHLVVTLAAQYGVNMFCEAPLAPTRAMMDVIRNVEAKSQLKIVIGEQMWRRPAEPLNKQAIAAGLIGDVIRVTSFYGPSGNDTCHHSMALMRHYAGADVVEIQGIRQPLEGEMWSQGFLKYANGVMGSITYTSNWLAPIRRGHPRFLSIEGTNGFIITGDGPGHMLRSAQNGQARDYPKQMELGHDSTGEYLVRCYYETDPLVEYLNPFGPHIAHDGDARSAERIFDELARASELASLHRAMTTGAQSDYGPSQAARDVELSIMLVESARRGTPLSASSETLGAETEWERNENEQFRRAFGADPIADLYRLVAAL
ncbi:MAG TPA: Gfo/Idh/MocA family oxidoreductase [Chloroflexota bacterium]